MDDLIARITAQTCRQSGLSVVYTDLLDFGGDEIYFVPRAPPRRHAPSAKLLAAYESCSVIGLRTEDGRIRLNPPAGSQNLSRTTRSSSSPRTTATILLSENAQAPEIDAGAIRKTQSRASGARAHPDPRLERPRADDNRRARRLRAAGSEVTVVTPGRAPAPVPASMGSRTRRSRSRVGDITDRRDARWAGGRPPTTT